MNASHAYGGRYAVIERVGVGGMAEVYRARDELLGRDVAVKVLSERLSRDRSFVERFRREAQSAANLSHPNIVSLYDYGSDDSTYFIVMEFIDGKPLSDIIGDEAPLMPERAAEIAADVARALQRAHASGVVHRDIKPGNIMITRTGLTKVTDFGIARARSRDGEQTVTQTGMVIGTAAYFSPEQAQGNAVDARSDVYSLGCVLYEMLTGSPPFSAETPLAVAYKHVRENPEPPSASNPDVPEALDAIVLKALAKNPDNRYSDALEMTQDLDRFLAGQTVQATPVLGDETLVTARPAGATEVLRPEEYVPPPAPGRGRGLWYALIALLVLGLLALAAWLVATNVLGGGAEPRFVRVPSLEGKDLDEALELLGRRGLDEQVERRASQRPVNLVLDQDPPAGDRIEEGDTVTLTVSSGPRQVEVPTLVGLPQDEAEARLADAGLRLGDVAEEFSDDVRAGIVIDQDPEEGETVDARDRVDILVSLGEETVTVPSVVDQPEASAEAELRDAGLGVRITSKPSTAAEGIVISQDPAAGEEASPGDVVSIVVSEGPEATPTPEGQALPDVTGQDADNAEAALEDDLGLDVSQQDETEPCTEPPGAVCRQSPAPGTTVSEGDSVILYVRPD